MSGQTTAILIVLMFGAGTDYCLLLVARFRDELRRTPDAGEAMERASERTGPAILSAGAIVDRRDARPHGRRLQRHAGDGADPRARHRRHGRRRADAAARDPGSLGRRAFWPVVPRVEAEPRPVPALWPRVGRSSVATPGSPRAW